jgi:hypothetical protein
MSKGRTMLCLAQSREPMRKPLVVLSGTGVRTILERVPSATEALHLIHDHMRLRRPSVRVEDERGNPVSFFQLKEMAKLEAGNERASRANDT